MTNKKEINHSDLFGDTLHKDDIVIAADGVRGQLTICKVINQTPKMVRIEPIDRNFNRWRSSFLRYPKFLIKIEKERAVEYILMLDV